MLTFADRVRSIALDTFPNESLITIASTRLEKMSGRLSDQDCKSLRNSSVLANVEVSECNISDEMERMIVDKANMKRWAPSSAFDVHSRCVDWAMKGFGERS